MKKLCLVFSACAALTFSGTVNAQSVGDTIQSTTGDYKAYEVLSENLFVNGSFEGSSEEGASIEGWYGGTNQPAVVGGSTAFKILAEGYKGQCLEFKAAGSGDPTSLRTWVQVEPGKSYYFNGYAKGTVATESWKWSYICECSSWGDVSEGASSYRFNVNNNSTWVQKTKIFENVQNGYIVVKFANTGNRIKIDEFSLVEIKEVPNLDLLDETKVSVSDLLMDEDQYEEELVQRLENWVEYAETKIDRTDCDAVSDAIATIKNITKDLASYNEKVKNVKAELTRASELGVDDAVWNAYLADPFYNIDGLCHDLIVEEFNVVKNLYAEGEDTKINFSSWSKLDGTSPWINTGSPKGGYAVDGKGKPNEHYDGKTDTEFYNFWNKTAGAYCNLTRSIELPAGEYVLKVSGRSNGAITTVTIGDDANSASVAFPTRPLTGYGIEKNGNVNYSADGDYANNGAGYGWEWRFIPLKLENITTVNISVDIKINVDNVKGCIADMILLRKNFNEYKRNVTSGDYGTICLPYEVDMTSVSGVEKIYTVSSMTNDLATLTPVEAMEAGKPYIFKSNADEVVMPAKVGGTVVGTPQKDTYLVGTFSDIDELAYDTYVLSGNKFYLVDSSVRCAAYRCYFKPVGNGVKNFGFVEDGGETTGINKVENEVDMKNAVIYDLTGRRVKSPVKGIYIVNGKKMIVDNLK